MNKEMLEGLRKRRSCRRFSPEQITDEELRSVLEAGTYAPTARGTQNPIIIAVQDPEEVKAVSELNARFAYNKDPYYSAPTILLVLVPEGAWMGELDGAAVITTLLNAAYAVGLGSCWINRPQYMFETTEGKDMLKRWGIQGNWKGVGSVALGYAVTKPPKAKPRKENYCYIIK